MTWKAISETGLWDLINSSWDRMTPPQKKMWDAIRILPQKWQENTYGELGNGYWVVAIFFVNLLFGIMILKMDLTVPHIPSLERLMIIFVTKTNWNCRYSI